LDEVTRAFTVHFFKAEPATWNSATQLAIRRQPAGLVNLPSPERGFAVAMGYEAQFRPPLDHAVVGLKHRRWSRAFHPAQSLQRGNKLGAQPERRVSLPVEVRPPVCEHMQPEAVRLVLCHSKVFGDSTGKLAVLQLHRLRVWVANRWRQFAPRYCLIRRSEMDTK
jgi:hypothetical protein